MSINTTHYWEGSSTPPQECSFTVSRQWLREKVLDLTFSGAIISKVLNFSREDKIERVEHWIYEDGQERLDLILDNGNKVSIRGGKNVREIC